MSCCERLNTETHEPVVTTSPEVGGQVKPTFLTASYVRVRRGISSSINKQPTGVSVWASRSRRKLHQRCHAQRAEAIVLFEGAGYDEITQRSTWQIRCGLSESSVVTITVLELLPSFFISQLLDSQIHHVGKQKCVGSETEGADGHRRSDGGTKALRPSGQDFPINLRPNYPIKDLEEDVVDGGCDRVMVDAPGDVDESLTNRRDRAHNDAVHYTICYIAQQCNRNKDFNPKMSCV